MKIIKKLFQIILILIALFGLFLGYMTIVDYKPKPVEYIEISINNEKQIDKQTISFLSWNIGYGGLGKEMDFFYDKGKMVRPTQEQAKKYITEIRNEIVRNDTIDFIYLQEVDINAKRSYYLNQYQYISDTIMQYNSAFATNYKVSFIPQPITKPMGKVNAGIATFTKYLPYDAKRYAFEGNFSWPMGLFFLDRCYMEMRYKLKNGKELVLINTHNSAFDDGSLRKKQMKMLKDKLISEYNNGNYVIAGGDWNQFPPYYKPKRQRGSIVGLHVEKNYPAQGWQWVSDTTSPTNRHINMPYDPEKSVQVVIDFYLISPNVIPETVKVLNKKFEFSDHNPVYARFTLK